MQKITNPYLPGQIPESKDGFFGREELVTWLEQQIIARRRVMVLHGPSLIGKTTFLRLAPQLLTLEAVIVTLSVAELSDPAPETVLTALMQTLARQAAPPADSPPPTDAVAAFDNLLAQTRQRRPAAEIALLLDDFDHFLTRFPVETDLFLGVCQTLLARHSYLHLLLALQSTSLPHLNHPLLDTAAVRQITVLKRNDALRMITRPVEGVLRFDYGVPKRIAELTSNHPHYLTLFNHTLFSRYAREGWVNLRHLDETLNDVLNTDIPSFTAIWQESTWVERAVLSAMASVKGTHGIFTRQEVLAALLRHDHKAEGKVILTALESLAYRGILVKMGALGYRFCVDLFRYWLQQQFNLPAVLNDVIWQEPAARPQPPSPEAVQPAPGPRTPAWPVWMWGLLGLALVGLLALGFTVLAARTRARVTPTPVIAPEQAVAGFKTALAPTPSPTVTSAPTATATPTPPIVVAKPLPSIAYMARRGENPWQIFVMNTDGSGVKAISDASADSTSPVWAPSGRQLAFVSRQDGNRDVYVMDIDGQNARNLSNNPADDWTPAWFPNGARLAFSSNRTGNWEIFTVDAGGDNLQQLTNTGSGNISPVWSPDGTRIAFSSKRDGNWEIYSMRADGTDLRRLTRNQVNDLAPIWSPDGSLIAYETNLDGNVEVYVMTGVGGNPRNISNMPYANDHGPAWTPDGRRLIFYSNREGNWDLFLTDLNGNEVVNLTNTADIDEQTPVWRP